MPSKRDTRGEEDSEGSPDYSRKSPKLGLCSVWDGPENMSLFPCILELCHGREKKMICK